MPEVLIKYKDARALNALKDFAKYFNFEISFPNSKTKIQTPQKKAVTILAADTSIDISNLSKIFSGKNLDAKKLRTDTWIRRK